MVYEGKEGSKTLPVAAVVTDCSLVSLPALPCRRCSAKSGAGWRQALFPSVPFLSRPKLHPHPPLPSYLATHLAVLQRPLLRSMAPPRKRGAASSSSSSASRASSSRGASRGRGARGAAKSKRSDRASKPSARYQRVLEDEAYAEQIQKTYSPSTNVNISSRQLPLQAIRERDGASFQTPSLASLCLEVVAKNFLTHVLPSQQTYDQAKGIEAIGSKGKGKHKDEKMPVSRGGGSRTLSASQIFGAVSKGIGKKRRRGESEEADGQDFVPSDDSDADAEQIGIAAGPSTRRRRAQEDQKPATSDDHVQATVEELTELSKENHQLLKLLPEGNLLKLLRLLKRHCSSALTRTILTTYFVTGRTHVELDASMSLLAERPELINLIIGAAGQPALPPTAALQVSAPLIRLSLSGLPQLSPQSLSALFRRSPLLQEVVLKGCVRVDAPCMKALVESGSMRALRILNANFTDIGLEGVESIISNGRSLVTLKVANVLGLKDQAVSDMVRRAVLHASEQDPPFSPLAKLQTLKVRGTEMSVVGLSSLIQLCKPTLDNLDVGGLRITLGDQIQLLAMSLGYEVGAEARPQAQDGLDNGEEYFEGEQEESNDEFGLRKFTVDTSIKAPLRKLNLSHNFQGLRHNDSYKGPYDSLVRWLPQMASTLRILILDGIPLRLNSFVQFSDFTLINRAFSKALDHIAMSHDGPAPEDPPGLTRISLSATHLTVLRPEDFWLHTGGEDASSLLANAEVSSLPIQGQRAVEDVATDLFSRPFLRCRLLTSLPRIFVSCAT